MEQAYKTIYFPSNDSLIITADEYSISNAKGYIVLCHRSHFNRGEYREIAPKLNALGYSCLAIDQRSGMKVLGTTNETYKLAKERGLPTGYLEAKPDIEAAISYAYKQNHDQPVILLGSSYAASLALLIASEGNKNVSAVVAFSPGEYLKGVQLADELKAITMPTLVVSAKKEIDATSQLLRNAKARFVKQYKPGNEGAHGARVLWPKTEGHKEFWGVLHSFLGALD